MIRTVLLATAIGFFVGSKRARGFIYCDNNCKTGDGYYCVQDDATAYSVCLGGVRLATMRCQTGLNWDSGLKLCNWPQAIATPCSCNSGGQQVATTTTTEAPTTTTKVTSTTTTAAAATTLGTSVNLDQCDNKCAKDGLYCVPNNPQAYYQCISGFRYPLQYCHSDLHYNYIYQSCDWPANYPGCNCIPTPIETTNEPVTTTSSTTTSTTTTTEPSRFSPPPNEDGFKRVCYYTNWAVYRPGPGSYTVSNVDPFMCTHIIVAFMNLNNAQISYLETGDPKTLASLTKLRDERNPALKVLVAIGGWNAGSWPFTLVVASNDTMDAFIDQAISFLRQNNLDGLDIDWEYPQGLVSQYSTWMQKMRDAFELEALQSGRNRLLLTAAVAAGQSNIDWAYDVKKLSKAVDMINLMSYDLNGAWNPTTGLNSGLYPQAGTDPFNVRWCSDYWVKKGADPQKLIIGIPTYGRTFKLCNPGPNQTGIGSRACGPGNAGTFTQSSGFEAYYESCLKLQCSKGNWTSVWSEPGQAPFMYSGNQWISYENVKSIAAKVNYAKSMNYGGVMVWTLDLDDFRDICGSGVKSPLMTTLVAAATGLPLPQLNETPQPTVNPCDPLNFGFSGAVSSGDSGSSSSSATTGSDANLDLCDNKCATNGLFCVPDNRQAFYQCLAGVRYPLQYCQSNLVYNYKSSSCDWPANYPGCNCIIANSTTTAKPVKKRFFKFNHLRRRY